MADNIFMHSEKNKKGVSLNELAYQRVKKALISLSYKPGDYVNIAQMMNDLSLGRTPLNQAIHKLANEGFFTIIPRKGIIVSALSIDDAMEIIDVRLVNESLCISRACERITAKDIMQLKEINQQLLIACNNRQHEKMITADLYFHQTLAEIASNKRLKDILNVIHSQSQRFWALTFSSEDHAINIVSEHNEIINALEMHDLSAALLSTTKHIESFKNTLLSL